MSERTDRELLELAAKATGACIREVGERGIRADEWVRQSDGTLLAPTRHGHAPWHPLTDDGDALRLAVKLAIHMRPKDDAMTVWAPKSARSFHEYATENGDDMNAATRKAIVRAAAEIGAKP